MAVLVPDERCLGLFRKKIVREKSKQAAFHPRPELPPSGEGSPLEKRYSQWIVKFSKFFN